MTRINHDFGGISGAAAAKVRAGKGEGRTPMFASIILRSVLHALATMFGSLGMFFLYMSYVRPAAAAYAILFLGIGSAIFLTSLQS